MKILVSELKAGLTRCMDAVVTASLVPDYSCITMMDDYMSAYNGVLGIHTRLGYKEPCTGPITVPAEKVQRYFSGYQDNVVADVIVTEDSKHIIFDVDGGGHLAVTKPVLTNPVKQFGVPKKANRVCTFDKKMTEASSYFTCVLGVDETRPITRNVSITSQDLTAYSTSGVAVGEFKLKKLGVYGDCILPHSFLNIVNKYTLLNTFDIFANKSAVYAYAKDMLIEHSVQNFSYPDLGKMLQQYRKLTSQVTLDAAEFSSKLQRVGALTDLADKNMVLLSFKGGKLTLKCDIADGSVATERLQYAGNLAETKVVFNYTYLKNYITMLTAAKNKLSIGFVTGQKGIVFTVLPEFLFVALPLQT